MTAKLFNKLFITGKKLWYIAKVHANGHLAGDGGFTKQCYAWLEARTGVLKALFAADLEMAMLGGMGRALRPGGGIALTVPQHPWLWSRQDDYACHVRSYCAGELQEKVRCAGFRVELDTSFVSLLMPTMLASRMAQRHAPPDSYHRRELCLPALLNHTFEAIMGLERLLIQSGLRSPIGGSLLLLVARKPKAEA